MDNYEYTNAACFLHLIIATVLTIIAFSICMNRVSSSSKASISRDDNLKLRCDTLQSVNDSQNKKILELENQLLIVSSKQDKETPIISRGSADRYVFKVTAYDLSYASCGKAVDNPEYGITASGAKVKSWHTIAAGPELQFGTRVYIPYFKDKPNNGIFVVEDRGSAITRGCIDVYMTSFNEAKKFGLKSLDCYILP